MGSDEFFHGRLEPVSDAIVPAMQYCLLRTLLYICNRVRGYAKTDSACTEPMYYAV